MHTDGSHPVLRTNPDILGLDGIVKELLDWRVGINRSFKELGLSEDIFDIRVGHSIPTVQDIVRADIGRSPTVSFHYDAINRGDILEMSLKPLLFIDNLRLPDWNSLWRCSSGRVKF